MPQSTGSRGEQQGFLYVEVLVSMLVLSLALLAVIPLFVLAARENASAGDMTYAMTAVQDVAETLKAADYADLASGSDELTLRSIRYQRTWTVQTDTPHAGMSTVEVTVVPQRQSSFGGQQTANMRFYRVDTP